MQQKFARNETVLLIGGGDPKISDIKSLNNVAQTCVAADGGVRFALAAGVEPAAVIGDFDSIDAEARARVPVEKQICIGEQESTDFEKCLGLIDANLILGLGFTARRLDHSLAALHSLVKYAPRDCILLGDYDVLVHVNKPLSIDLPQDSRVSLFPMRPVRAFATGLRWPVEDLRLETGTQIGTSNRAEGRIHIESDRPGLVLLLPRANLDALLAAVRQSSGRFN